MTAGCNAQRHLPTRRCRGCHTRRKEREKVQLPRPPHRRSPQSTRARAHPTAVYFSPHPTVSAVITQTMFFTCTHELHASTNRGRGECARHETVTLLGERSCEGWKVQRERTAMHCLVSPARAVFRGCCCLRDWAERAKTTHAHTKQGYMQLFSFSSFLLRSTATVSLPRPSLIHDARPIHGEPTYGVIM